LLHGGAALRRADAGSVTSATDHEVNQVSVAELIDLKELLDENHPFGQDEIRTLADAMASSQSSEARQYLTELGGRLDDGESLSDAELFRLGILNYLFGRHGKAVEILTSVKDEPLAPFYAAQSLVSLERFDEAAEQFDEAINRGHDRVGCTLMKAGAIRAGGDIEEAEKILKSIASDAASRAEYSFQMGCIMADRGDTFGAVEYFERAVDMDPHHSRALFWLAAENALHGNDEDAIRLYEQALSKPPYYMGALLNLGLLYEDSENYGAAAYCFRRVLEYDPNNARAELYLKDIDATKDMYYDEDSVKQEQKMQQLLSKPVTDFELSVRSRNCLASMDIHTLGDLTEVSEQELLGGKNFGETSLHEIRDLLAAHGLRIGQNLHKAKQQEMIMEQENLSPQEQAMLNKPVTDLNLSVRSRKCMARLGISTIGSLIQRTPDELLASRNFGVTSLNEIRAKLSEVDLKLRND
jgi:DNA-directed RNA polymerase subunit alpha